MNRNNSNNHFPIVWVLTVCFIVLKLCGAITWTWWWVLSPLWIGFAVLLMLGIVWAIFDRED